MPLPWRSMRTAALAALALMMISALAAPPSFAQDEDSAVVIQGSQQLEALLRAIRDAYVETAPDADVQIDPQGPSRGFDALCSGEADLVMATAPIEDGVAARCAQQGQGFIETVLAYQAVVLLAPTSAELTCLDRGQIETYWSLGAPADVLWSDLGSTALTGAVRFVGPEAFGPAANVFRALLPAGELRDDLETFDSAQAVAEAVASAEAPALGFVSHADFEALALEGVTALSVRHEAGECIPPGLDTLEDRSYPLAQTAYLYVNAASAQREPVRQFLEFALTNEAGAQTIVPAQGFTAPTTATLNLGLNNVLNGTVGRTFTRPVTPVNIATTEAGTIAVAGTSILADLTRDIAAGFTARYTQAQVEQTTLGDAAGWEAFCAGEADVLQTTRDATDEERALCEENGIEPYTVDLGYEAVIFAVPAANDWLACLNGETFEAIFARSTDDSPATGSWDAVDADWPESEMLLVVPPLSSGETDFVAYRLLGRLDFLMREDVVADDDPLYRAAGVANTDNGLTYLLWSAFQGSEAGVNLVEIDAGDGCVAPSPETFADGSYALAYPVRYVFSMQSLTKPLVRAFLWQMYDAATVERLSETPFAGLDLEQFAGPQRDEAFDFLASLESLPPEPEVEATEEPAAEPEATEEPVEEAPAEATEEPTEEAPAEATEEPTDEPTEEAPADDAG